MVIYPRVLNIDPSKCNLPTKIFIFVDGVQIESSPFIGGGKSKRAIGYPANTIYKFKGTGKLLGGKY